MRLILFIFKDTEFIFTFSSDELRNVSLTRASPRAEISVTHCPVEGANTRDGIEPFASTHSAFSHATIECEFQATGDGLFPLPALLSLSPSLVNSAFESKNSSLRAEQARF